MKKVFRGLPSPEERLDCAVAIGNFDGVHRGHQALLHEVVEAAHARLLCPAVLTFEPHPREFFNPEDAPRRISSLHDKVEAIEVTVQTHQFEQNLELGRDDNGSREAEAGVGRRRTRRINLNTAFAEDEPQTEEDRIAADMMSANGNTVDFTA